VREQLLKDPLSCPKQGCIWPFNRPARVVARQHPAAVCCMQITLVALWCTHSWKGVSAYMRHYEAHATRL
jgi:hypothetical protein